MLNLRQLCALAVALVAMACGGSSSPTAPSIANVAGTWLGTMQYSQQPQAGTPVQAAQSVSMTLTQSNTTVGGTWTTTNGGTRNGTVGGSVTANSLTGSLTYNSTSANGGACIGTLAVSGTVTGNSLTLTSPIVTENCTDPPTNLTFTVVRQ